MREQRHSRAFLPMHILLERVEIEKSQDLAASVVGPERRDHLLLDGTGVST